MTDEDVPHFWCRDGNGQISMPGKRRITSNPCSRSDIRVQAALAKSKRRMDCRCKTLYQICLNTCIRHVNAIKWDNVAQHIAADILSAAHQAGTISDNTAGKLSESCMQTNFITGLNLSRCSLQRSWMDNIIRLKDRLTFLDLARSPLSKTHDWIAKCLTKLTRLLWLNLSGTNIEDSDIKKLVYPTKFCDKGLKDLLYLDISGNHRLTNDGTDLALSLPKLEILITEVSVQKYFLFPKHCLVNWGHDIVIRWITGDMPAKSSVSVSSFYKSELGDNEENHTYNYKAMVLKDIKSETSNLVIALNLKVKPQEKPFNFSQKYNHDLKMNENIKDRKYQNNVPIKRKRLPIKCVPNKMMKINKTSSQSANDADNYLLKCYKQKDPNQSSGNLSLFKQLNQTN